MAKRYRVGGLIRNIGRECPDGQKRKRTTALQDASRRSRPQVSPPGLGLRQSSGALARAREEHGRNHSGRRTRQVGKAVEDYRSPRRFATIKAAGESARSWSAPVLWRFGSGIGLATGQSSSQVYARSAKNGRGLPQSKTLSENRGRAQIRQVLD